MKVVLIRGIQGKTLTFCVNGWMRWTISCCLLGLPFGLGWLASQQFTQNDTVPAFFADVAVAIDDDLQKQQDLYLQAKTENDLKVQAMAARIAQLQSQLLRMEALGERVIAMADLESEEFDFSSTPAVGGPETALTELQNSASVSEDITELEQKIEQRSVQISMLIELLQDRHLNAQAMPSGLPAASGWISSPYGRRNDPFTGKSAWHNGVDIAGKTGTDVLAVAAGVVTAVENKSGYGKLVEITHDNGFVTRYAHNKTLKVELGDIVSKGQAIAAMGSTGRSTGPHVHFEVFKHGRSVDPASYIRRTIR